MGRLKELGSRVRQALNSFAVAVAIAGHAAAIGWPLAAHAQITIDQGVLDRLGPPRSLPPPPPPPGPSVGGMTLAPSQGQLMPRPDGSMRTPPRRASRPRTARAPAPPPSQIPAPDTGPEAPGQPVAAPAESPPAVTLPLPTPPAPPDPPVLALPVPPEWVPPPQPAVAALPAAVAAPAVPAPTRATVPRAAATPPAVAAPPAAATPPPVLPAAPPPPPVVAAAPARQPAPPAAGVAPLPSAPPAAPSQATALVPTSRSTQAVVGSTLKLPFRPADSTLNPDARARLTGFARDLPADDSVTRVMIVAYGDDPEGDSSRARRLALARAIEARGVLLAAGIRSTRIDVRAMGKPTDGSDPDRVDVSLSGPAGSASR